MAQGRELIGSIVESFWGPNDLLCAGTGRSRRDLIGVGEEQRRGRETVEEEVVEERRRRRRGLEDDEGSYPERLIYSVLLLWSEIKNASDSLSSSGRP